jgi:hypothetical protein
MLLFLLYCHNYSGLLSLVVVVFVCPVLGLAIWKLAHWCENMWILSLIQLAFSIAIVPTLRYPPCSSGPKHLTSLFHGSSPTLDSQGHIQINHWSTDWTACDGAVRSSILGRMVAPICTMQQARPLAWLMIFLTKDQVYAYRNIIYDNMCIYI